MKYYSVISVFLALSIAASAQKTVKMSAVKSNDYGVAYTLPNTALVLTATVTKTERKAGEFYQYAERYLNVSNPITKDETTYTLDKVDAKTIGVPDRSNSYLVEFRSNTSAPYVTLTADGLICAINSDAVFQAEEEASAPVNEKQTLVNPKTILSEEILRAGSVAKQAELVAKQIYLLRESRTNILTGEADNMPPDGAAYKLVMEQLEANEKALMSMFIGRETKETYTKQFTVNVGDSNIDKQIVFRFSSKLGVVADNDLAGAPVYLSLKSELPLDVAPLTEKEQKALDKKFASGIVYNIPGKADLRVDYEGLILVKKTCDVVQYGTQEVLVTKMFDNKQPIKVIFYPSLGAIKQIIE